MVQISDLDVSKLNGGNGLPHGLCDLCTENCLDIKFV